MRNAKHWWKHGCCNLCFVLFVEGREVRWSEGWRPSAEEVKVALGNISQD